MSEYLGTGITGRVAVRLRLAFIGAVRPVQRDCRSDVSDYHVNRVGIAAAVSVVNGDAHRRTPRAVEELAVEAPGPRRGIEAVVRQRAARTAAGSMSEYLGTGIIGRVAIRLRLALVGAVRPVHPVPPLRASDRHVNRVGIAAAVSVVNGDAHRRTPNAVEELAVEAPDPCRGIEAV